MKKFDEWNILKKSINNYVKVKFVRESDIWWCSIGVNIKSEQDGKNDLFERQVVVIKKFNNDIVWIVPLSSKFKDNIYCITVKNCTALVSQIRLVSTARFSRYVGKISREELESIKNRIKDIL